MKKSIILIFTFLSIYLNAQTTVSKPVTYTPLAPITANGTVTVNSTFTATGTVNGIDKTDVGLSSVDNTSDATKNVLSATKFTVARTINGVSFDGTGNITVTSAAGTLSGTTLNSTVVTSSLTSVGTLVNLTVTNPISGSITGNAATVTTNANLTGPITSSGNATSVTANAITNIMLADVPTATFKGRITASTGDPEDLTATQATALLNVSTTSLKGLESAADKSITENFKKGFVNILDFGADPTNATSSATALTNAIASIPNGGVVFFPAGTYNFGNVAYLLSTAHITLLGASRYNTKITTTSTTADILQIGQFYNVIQSMSFIGPGTGENPTRTAGFAINGNGAGFPAYTSVKDCSFFYQFDCINVANVLMSVEDIECRFFKNSGIVVDHNSDHQIRKAIMDNNTSFLPTGAGIDVKQTASLMLDNCNIIHANWGLNVSPAGGITIPSIKASNCFFDNSVIGLRCAGAGFFYRSEFTNCWFSSMSTAGILFAPTTADGVDGITFVNCDIYNNVAGTTNGVSVTTANVGKWKMVGCTIAGWTNGINIIAGTLHFPTILSTTIGGVAAFANNGTGIVVGAGSYQGLVITGNDVVDNTTALTLGAVTPSAGNRYRITDNAGINPRGTVTPPAVPASTVVTTNNTGFRVTVYVKAGTLTVVTINGVSINQTATAGTGFPLGHVLDPGGTIAITYSVAPTWVWVAN